MEGFGQILLVHVAGGDINHGTSRISIHPKDFLILLNGLRTTVVAAEEMCEIKACPGVIGVFVQISLKQLQAVCKMVLTYFKHGPHIEALALRSPAGKLECALVVFLAFGRVIKDVAVEGAPQSSMNHGEIRINLQSGFPELLGLFVLGLAP